MAKINKTYKPGDEFTPDSVNEIITAINDNSSLRLIYDNPNPSSNINNATEICSIYTATCLLLVCKVNATSDILNSTFIPVLKNRNKFRVSDYDATIGKVIARTFTINNNVLSVENAVVMNNFGEDSISNDKIIPLYVYAIFE